MQIGLGLPNSLQSLRDGRVLVDLAQRGEGLGFSVLGTIGRIAYPTYEELMVLAAAAAVTERIRLTTDVLIAAAREPVLLAKQAATLDQVSGGRFVLGIGTGGRPADFDATGLGFRDRGRRLDASLELMQRAWRGEPLPGTDRPATPRTTNGQSVPMVFGGGHENVVRRVVRHGIGYTMGGGDPQGFGQMKQRVDAAWREAGRDGRPHYTALSYFALGDEVAREAEENVLAYYGEFGPRVWAAAIKTPEQARERVAMFEAAGCDELILFMTAPGAEQAERLAEAVL